MRVAIVGDTHLPRGERVVPAACLDACRAADAIIHTGDLTDVAALELFERLGPPLHAVHGNVDGPDVRARLPEAREVDLGGVRMGLVHIPGPADGRAERLRRRFPTCAAAIFGHTHMPEHAELPGGFQIFNPGSPTERRRAPRHTMGLATITGGAVRFELVTLG